VNNKIEDDFGKDNIHQKTGLTVGVQDGKLFEGKNTEVDIERHVDEWIALNQETRNGWLAETCKFAN
jgi:ABC-type proline/glycine betaine transport system substrate-binding protein